MTDPKEFFCDQCHAPPGKRCTNYLGKQCAPHRLRVAKAKVRDRVNKSAASRRYSLQSPSNQPQLPGMEGV